MAAYMGTFSSIDRRNVRRVSCTSKISCVHGISMLSFFGQSIGRFRSFLTPIPSCERPACALFRRIICRRDFFQTLSATIIVYYYCPNFSTSIRLGFPQISSHRHYFAVQPILFLFFPFLLCSNLPLVALRTAGAQSQ